MREDAVGAVVYDATLIVEPTKISELEAAIGTPTGEETARLALWFGVTVGGDDRLVEAIGLDLSRAMLAGNRYEWRRPFETGEQIQTRITVQDIYRKGGNQFAILLTEFRDADGDLVQSQSTTFIEKSAA